MGNEEANQVQELPSREAEAETVPKREGKSFFQKVPEKPPVADKSAKARPRRNNVCRNAGASLSARGPSPGTPSSAQTQMPLSARDLGYSSMTQGFVEPEPSAKDVCKDLDAFEVVCKPVARLGNFFSAPHVPRTPQPAAAPASSGEKQLEPLTTTMTPEAAEKANENVDVSEQQ